jgi:6-pyruvoyltetrahydropterin/6-carboxytetrahydropterin synthase
MYSVAVSRDFIAQHYLIGGDWGAESQRHSHPYRVEVQLEGPRLNPHGFLVDIVEIESGLNSLVKHFQDSTLNDQPEFAGLNPSIEHFCRILCEGLWGQMHATEVTALTVRLWEHSNAWAAYRLER